MLSPVLHQFFTNLLPSRYYNMNYILMSSIIRVIAILVIIASYDIACQFFVNFFSCITGLPPKLQQTVHTIKPKVLKVHIVGHGPFCQSCYSFNWSKGVGWTEGEGIEQDWLMLNKVTPSTKEITPSGQWETIDNFCGYINWRKILSLSELSLLRFKLRFEAVGDTIPRWQAASKTHWSALRGSRT